MSLTHKKTNSAIAAYNKIYQAAKNANTQELKDLIEDENICVDVRIFGDKGLQTPACQLAREGETAAVERLRRMGANPTWIAFGYALSGDIDSADNERKTNNADTDIIACGLAASGMSACDEFVERYRTKFGADVNDIAGGYVLAKNATKVTQYQYEFDANDISVLVRNYVIAGEHGKAKDLIDGQSSEYQQAYATVAAKTYAMAGDAEKAMFFRDTYKADINQIAQGFAMGGYIDEAKDCVKSYGADVNKVCEGLALAGHFDELLSFKKDLKVNLDFVAQALAYAGYPEEAKRYSQNLSAIAKGCALSGNVKNLEMVLQEKKDALTIEVMAQALLNSGKIKDDKSMIRQLINLNDHDLIIKLSEKISEMRPGEPNLKNLGETISHLKDMSVAYSLNYDQVLALRDSRVQKLLQDYNQKGKEDKFEALVVEINKITPLSKNDVKKLASVSKVLEERNTLDSPEADDTAQLLGSEKKKNHSGFFSKSIQKMMSAVTHPNKNKPK